MCYQYIEGIKVIIQWFAWWLINIAIVVGAGFTGFSIYFKIQENKEHKKKYMKIRKTRAAARIAS